MTPIQKIVSVLTTTYQISDKTQLSLLYNGNSALFSSQRDDWNTAVGNTGMNKDLQSYDASLTSDDKSNKSIKIPKSIKNAVGKTQFGSPRGLVTSSDPYFTMQRTKIIQKLAKKNDPSVANVVVCFPFDEYFADATDSDGPNLSACMAWGPSLSEVYGQLGSTAASLIPGNFTPSVQGTSGVTYYLSGT